MCISNTSEFLAHVMGWYLGLVGLAMLIHQARFKKAMHDMASNQSLVTFTGMIGLILGLLVVTCHNVWGSQWPVVVTIVGWILLLQGLMRLFLPGAFAKMIKDLTAKSGFLLMSWVWLLVGIYLLWAVMHMSS